MLRISSTFANSIVPGGRSITQLYVRFDCVSVRHQLDLAQLRLPTNDKDAGALGSLRGDHRADSID